jgi:hypothetical protein
MPKKPKEVYAFRIRKNGTNLYSTGTGSPTFTEKGKVWFGTGPLKNHIIVALEYSGNIYNDCTIERYLLMPWAATTISKAILDGAINITGQPRSRYCDVTITKEWLGDKWEWNVPEDITKVVKIGT